MSSSHVDPSPASDRHRVRQTNVTNVTASSAVLTIIPDIPRSESNSSAASAGYTAGRLFTDGLRTIFAFLTWREMRMACNRVCANWLRAVRSIRRPLQIVIYDDKHRLIDLLAACDRDPNLHRSVASIHCGDWDRGTGRGRMTFLMHEPLCDPLKLRDMELSSVIAAFPDLRGLEAAIVIPESPSFLSHGLRSLLLQLPKSFTSDLQASRMDSLMQRIGELQLLEILQLFLPSSPHPIDFTPLHRLPILKFLAILGRGAMRLSSAQLHVLRQLSTLEELNIDNGNFSPSLDEDAGVPSSLDVLLADGHSLQRLKRMDMRFTYLTPQQVSRLHTLVSLEELRPAEWPRVSGAHNFSFLPSLRHLTVLWIGFRNWSDLTRAETALMMECVGECTSLKELTFDHVYIRPRRGGEILLPSMLSRLTQLTSLNFLAVLLPCLSSIFHIAHQLRHLTLDRCWELIQFTDGRVHREEFVSADLSEFRALSQLVALRVLDTFLLFSPSLVNALQSSFSNRSPASIFPHLTHYHLVSDDEWHFSHPNHVYARGPRPTRVTPTGGSGAECVQLGTRWYC
jgi:hypothetical protein